MVSLLFGSSSILRHPAPLRMPPLGTDAGGGAPGTRTGNTPAASSAVGLVGLRVQQGFDRPRARRTFSVRPSRPAAVAYVLAKAGVRAEELNSGQVDDGVCRGRGRRRRRRRGWQAGGRLEIFRRVACWEHLGPRVQRPADVALDPALRHPVHRDRRRRCLSVEADRNRLAGATGTDLCDAAAVAVQPTGVAAREECPGSPAAGGVLRVQGLRTAQRGAVSAAKAAEAQGKGSVLPGRSTTVPPVASPARLRARPPARRGSSQPSPRPWCTPQPRGSWRPARVRGRACPPRPRAHRAVRWPASRRAPIDRP